MEEEIRRYINNSEELEKLYHTDRKAFESALVNIFPEIENTELARFWKARLNYGKTTDRMKIPALSEIIAMIAVCLITVFLIKLPDFFHLNPDVSNFYEKNAAIIVFFGLTLFAIWTSKS